MNYFICTSHQRFLQVPEEPAYGQLPPGSSYLDTALLTLAPFATRRLSGTACCAWIHLPATADLHLECLNSAIKHCSGQRSPRFFEGCFGLKGIRSSGCSSATGGHKQRYNHQQIRPKPYTPARHLAFLPQSFSIFLKYSP